MNNIELSPPPHGLLSGLLTDVKLGRGKGLAQPNHLIGPEVDDEINVLSESRFAVDSAGERTHKAIGDPLGLQNVDGQSQQVFLLHVIQLRFPVLNQLGPPQAVSPANSGTVPVSDKRVVPSIVEIEADRNFSGLRGDSRVIRNATSWETLAGFQSG